MKRLIFTRVSAVLLLALCGCSFQLTSSSSSGDQTELIFYDWFNDLPANVIDQFYDETGIRVRYRPYQSSEEIDQQIRQGLIFDVAAIDSNYILSLAENGYLSELDADKIPNQKNIANDFRGLIYDPDNRYSIPFNWGTTGLLVRGDLVQQATWRWSDLWEARFASRIVIRNLPKEMIAVALKVNGYPINCEDPQALAVAEKRLLALKPAVIIARQGEKAVETFLQNNALLMVGWTQDAALAAKLNPAVRYVVPEEGALLWSNNFVVSAQSTHKQEAEMFINFLLRPEVSAQIVNANRYPTANEAAKAFVHPAILADPLVFPDVQQLKKAEWYMQLTPEGEKAYADLWQRFLTSKGN